MKFFCLLVFTAFLLSGSRATAQEPTGAGQWEWIKTEYADGWSAYKGVATVEITDGKIHAVLRYDDGFYLFQFDVSGSIDFGMLGEEYPGIQPGKVTVTVTRYASDATPSEFVGTYRKAIYPELARRSFGILFDEMIVLGDTVSTISFYRATKDTPSPR